MENEHLKWLTGQILDAAIAVHKIMGPGLVESVYEHCLMKEFELRNIKAQRQVHIPLIYKGFNLPKEYVIDILVDDQIIVELKTVETLLPVHEAQIISYLKLANKKIGILINFKESLLKNGFRRFVNNY